MGFNSAFKGLNCSRLLRRTYNYCT